MWSGVCESAGCRPNWPHLAPTFHSWDTLLRLRQVCRAHRAAIDSEPPLSRRLGELTFPASYEHNISGLASLLPPEALVLGLEGRRGAGLSGEREVQREQRPRVGPATWSHLARRATPGFPFLMVLQAVGLDASEHRKVQ